MKKSNVILLSILLLLSFNIKAYNYLPIVKCFDKSDYKAGRQNWDIGTDSNGIVYFGNSDGLLRNIYGQWELAPTENNDVVRSLKIQNDTIWCAGGIDYGYFVKDNPGNLTYHLVGRISGGDVWSIECDNQMVYFQTKGAIIAFNKQTNETQEIYAESGFSDLELWNNQLWAVTNNGCIGKITDTSFEIQIQSDLLKGAEIRKVFSHYNLLKIVLFDGRILSFDGDVIIKDKLPNQIEGKAFFTGASYDKGEMLIGTISDGLVKVNSEKITMRINSDGGLIDNTVLSIGEDLNGNVWLGLDYGIAYVELQNAIKPIFNKGATYFIQDYNNGTYLSTNKGLYVSKESESFSLIKNSEGQVWRTREIDNELLVCHNKGLFRVSNHQMTEVYGGDGIMDVAHFVGTPYYLFSGYSGLLLVEKSKNGIKVIENLNIWGNPKLIYDEVNKCIWADTKWEPVIQLKVDDTGIVSRHQHKAIENYFVCEDHIVYYDGMKLLEYKAGGFENIKEAPFNTIEGENIVALDADKHTNYVAYVQNGKPNMLANLHDGNFYAYTKLLSSLKNRLIENDEFIDLIEGELRIATDRGVTTFNVEASSKTISHERIAISKIVAQGEDIQIFTFPYVVEQIDLEAGDKNITFHYGVKKASNDMVEFRYRLWPYDKEWSDWEINTLSKAYTQLKGGVYKFTIQSRINGGIGHERSISLNIEKLWYQTKLILLPIFLLFVFCILLTIRVMHRLNAYKLKKESKRYKDDLLKQTVDLKNQQLLQYTEVISHKNGFLIELKEGLAKMRNAEARQWENKIMEEVNNEKKNFLFHKLFSEIHQDFITRITERYTSLTSNDVRMLSFIRINLGNKEIANLMNISSKSVDVSRYRLRKKLELPHESDLNLFIREF